MRRLIATLAITAALSPVVAWAQTTPAPAPAPQNHVSLAGQTQRLGAAHTANIQAQQNQVENQQIQNNLATLQAQSTNLSSPPTAPLYGSSSAMARGAATANTVPASGIVPDVVGGPLNLPGPTEPGVGAYSTTTAGSSVAGSTVSRTAVP